MQRFTVVTSSVIAKHSTFHGGDVIGLRKSIQSASVVTSSVYANQFKKRKRLPGDCCPATIFLDKLPKPTPAAGVAGAAGAAASGGRGCQRRALRIARRAVRGNGLCSPRRTLRGNALRPAPRRSALRTTRLCATELCAPRAAALRPARRALRGNVLRPAPQRSALRATRLCAPRGGPLRPAPRGGLPRPDRRGAAGGAVPAADPADGGRAAPRHVRRERRGGKAHRQRFAQRWKACQEQDRSRPWPLPEPHNCAQWKCKCTFYSIFLYCQY